LSAIYFAPCDKLLALTKEYKELQVINDCMFFKSTVLTCLLFKGLEERVHDHLHAAQAILKAEADIHVFSNSTSMLKMRSGGFMTLTHIIEQSCMKSCGLYSK
jgi:hypothetical protein